MEDPASKLATYRQQLAQVDAAIEKDPENPEWKKLRSDLLEVIQLTSELAQVTSSTSQGQADAVRTYVMGEKCQAIFEMDGQWYNAKVVATAEDGYFVTFLGYGNTAQVDFNEIRPYQRPDTSTWSPGAECSAVHPGDGRWYDATIIDTKGNKGLTMTVAFKGETEASEVEVDFVRLKLATVELKRKLEDEEVKAAAARDSKLPKSLEIQPDDSAEDVQKKKKKLAMYKRQERKAQELKQGEGRRSTWQQFSKKNKVVSKSKNYHDPNWDPTRDHGELAARQQMEKYSTYLVRENAV